MLLTTEESLAGGTLLGIESCEDLAKDNVPAFISEHFEIFIKLSAI
jgi:hypothetical protein